MQEASPSESPYAQAASVLDDFFERQRSCLSCGLVAGIDHYFSYGESGIARSLIAEAIQKKAASGAAVNPRVADAAACVLNEFS